MFLFYLILPRDHVVLNEYQFCTQRYDRSITRFDSTFVQLTCDNILILAVYIHIALLLGNTISTESVASAAMLTLKA